MKVSNTLMNDYITKYDIVLLIIKFITTFSNIILLIYLVFLIGYVFETNN
jgi:hypothetical protein